jgi:tRNA-2-methylthio-N6-dimethylallyladenosine synthase
MARKLYIKTYGCQMNEYDSAKMADVLAAAEGMEATADPAAADVILFNTCSVREKAQEKVFHDLGRVKHLKKERPGLLIGVGGCVASQEGAAIVARAPHVDVVFGPQTLHRLPALLDARRRTGKPQVDISFPEIEKFDNLPPVRLAGASAFVSIMEGCSKYCSFCVVPYTRGEEVSRPFGDVLTEVAELALAGVKEITLLGQNVNAYRGKIDGDIKDAASSAGGAPDSADFALLLEYVAEIPGLERIRYTTSHPKEFTQRLIDAYVRIPKLAGHVHLPLQSGSDRVLAAMKRGYTTLEYKSIIRRLRAARPDIAISSDFIVGFPGETERDFEATLKLIAEIGFDDSYSFLYSPRPGTPAAELSDDTPQRAKKQRLARLQALIEQQARAIDQSMIGSTQRVLVAGPAKRNASELCGRSDSNRMVNFAGPREFVGRMIDVTITAALAHSLRGEVRAPKAGGECRVPPPAGEVRVPPSGGECRVPYPAGEFRATR